MYSILLKESNILTPTNKERIMQRSKLFDNLRFVVEPIYKGYDMSGCTVLLEYLLPVSKKYRSEILVLDEERYEDFLVYKLPIDTALTSEAGNIEVQLTFILVDMDEEGNPIQRVRKTQGTCIEILPIKAWSDIIPDEALSALDQRIIMMDAQLKAMEEMTEIMMDSKADNLTYYSESKEIQLMSGANPIGDKVSLDIFEVPDEMEVVKF